MAMFGHRRSLEGGFRVICAVCSITAGSGQEAGIPPSILKDLSAEKFVEREAAQASLQQWLGKAPEKSVDVVLELAWKGEDPEVRSRAMEAVKAHVLEREYHADGFLGIGMQDVEVKLPGEAGQTKAIRVTLVIENSAASEAGITEGTLIVGLGDRMWKEGNMNLEFREQVQRTRPGTMVTLQLLENGAIVRKVLKLGERPAQAAGIGEQDPVKANQIARDEFFRRWLNKRVKQRR